MTMYFIGQVASPAEAPMQTIAWVGQQVLTQASFLAYMDAFWGLTLLALAAGPLALMLRKVKLGGGGAPAGHCGTSITSSSGGRASQHFSASAIVNLTRGAARTS